MLWSIMDMLVSARMYNLPLKYCALNIFEHRTSRLPVIYVFGKQHIDVDDCVAQLSRIVREQLESDSSKKVVLVKTDVAYAYIIGTMLSIRIP